MTSHSVLLLMFVTSSLVESQSYVTALRGRYLPHRKFVTLYDPPVFRRALTFNGPFKEYIVRPNVL